MEVAAFTLFASELRLTGTTVPGVGHLSAGTSEKLRECVFFAGLLAGGVLG